MDINKKCKRCLKVTVHKFYRESGYVCTECGHLEDSPLSNVKDLVCSDCNFELKPKVQPYPENILVCPRCSSKNIHPISRMRKQKSKCDKTLCMHNNEKNGICKLEKCIQKQDQTFDLTKLNELEIKKLNRHD